MSNTKHLPEWARRAHAARALCGLSVQEFAEALGMSTSTLGRTMQKTQAGFPHQHDSLLQLVAQITGVPYPQWFSVDFDRLTELGPANGLPTPPGELGRRAQGSPPTDEHPERDETDEGEDEQRGGG